MTEDCRNDCAEPLRFPRRPGTRPAARCAPGEACQEEQGVCGAQQQRVSEDNRPGLPHFNYRIGTYADIRAKLLHDLNQTVNLSAWTHRGADDPGIALLEGAAILGDILTFYQELYANEAFLRTAQWRESVADLVRLLGYRLSPALGGNATFAFEVKGDEPVLVPANFPVKAQLEDHDKPSEFETIEPLTAYPWLSKFNLYRRLFTPDITPSTTEFYIFAPDQFLAPVELKPGDRLLVGEADNAANPARLTQAEVVIVDSIRELHGRKLFKIKGALKRSGNVFNLAAFKLGRTFHHFGYNAPPTFVKPPSSVSTTATTTTTGSTTTTTSTSNAIQEKKTAFSRFLTSATYSSDPAIGYLNNTGTTRVLVPSLGQQEFPLEAEVRDLPSGVTLVIQAGLYKDSSSPAKEFTLVRKVTSVNSTPLTWGVLTGSTSLVTLNQSLAASDGGSTYSFTDIRDFQFHEVLSPPLMLRAGLQETSAAAGNELYFLGTDAQAQVLNGRRLLLVKPDAEPEAVSVAAVQTLAAEFAARPLLRRITLDHDLNLTDFPNEKPVITVYGNLADATEGKSGPSVPLGNGDSRQIFQTFKLPKKPLTYHLSAEASPPETPELQIYVNDQLWQLAASFFGRGPKEEIYIVREDAAGDSWVQFGDGKTGARLPSGVKNVLAQFRTGTGAFGALQAETKVQAGAKLKRLDQVQMPAIATGGSEPEDAENARAAAPGKIQSLDRLVSLQDFESEAAAIAGVARASAAWQLVDNIPAVAITVLMETGRAGELESVRGNLAKSNSGRGPHRFPIIVVPGRRQYLHIRATFALDPRFREEPVKASIATALGVNFGKAGNGEAPAGLFGLRQRRFGEREYATRIEGVIQNVAGVVWARVTAFAPLADTDDPASIAQSSLPDIFNDIVPCDSNRILSLYAPHLFLMSVAPQPVEVA